MDNIKKDLLSLVKAVGVGNITEARDYIENALGKACEVLKSDKNLTLSATLKGERDYTLMLEAHIDQIAFIVTDIDKNGFLTLQKCGGFDIRTLPATKVLIHTKAEKYIGTFCSIPPHLNSKDTDFSDISDFKVDSLLGKTAKDKIALGDYVTFLSEGTCLLNDRICAPALDDRAGCVCLLELFRRLKDKALPFNVCFSFCDSEEVGNRGAIIEGFAISPDEAVVIDVSFGTAPDVTPLEGGALGEGAMLGISPFLDKDVTERLKKAAEDNSIPYQTEIMGGKTSTDSDVISVSKSGVKTGLLSIPLRNMHTANEIIDLNDIKYLCDLLYAYILSGGALYD